jgi:hypothetical protein
MRAAAQVFQKSVFKFLKLQKKLLKAESYQRILLLATITNY